MQHIKATASTLCGGLTSEKVVGQAGHLIFALCANCSAKVASESVEVWIV